MSPAGDCLRLPAGAFLGKKGSIWVYCRKHREDIADMVCIHSGTDEFPLEEISIQEALVYDVMKS